MARDPNLSIVVSDHLERVYYNPELASQFIARMIQEYKAMLVKYVEFTQEEIDKCAGVQPDLCGLDYFRDELAEAMRRLTLSDAELLPLITPLHPHFLTD